MTADLFEDREHAQKHRALLDGADVSDRCFYADSDAGVVRLYKLDSEGKPFVEDDGRAATEEIRGEVILLRRDE